MAFVDRKQELTALKRWWHSRRAQFIPVTGRRRVGKTTLLEHFAEGKRMVYYRCRLAATDGQLPLLGAALATFSGDSVLIAQPPASWPAVFALLERLSREGRFLLILDELPYWVHRDESVPSVIQNWWDEKGSNLDLMVVICGSAVSTMEKLLTGPAPLAGCMTGRLQVHPFDLPSAADLLGFADPVDSLTAYGILGGVPLYLSYFLPDLSISDNILEAIASPTARMYVEPAALFASHHVAFNAQQALAVLRAIANRHYRWSEIGEAAGIRANLERVMEPLMGDMGLVRRVLPVTEEAKEKPGKGYYVQYHLTDNYLRFYFRYIEPNQGLIEFGAGNQVVDAIMADLPSFLGPVYEEMCRDWTRAATAAGILPVRPNRIGSWWIADHELDVVGLDSRGKAILTGEAKWHNTQEFDWDDLTKYLGHVQALGDLLSPGAHHLLFSKSGYADGVKRWAEANSATMVSPADMLTTRR